MIWQRLKRPPRIISTTILIFGLTVAASTPPSSAAPSTKARHRTLPTWRPGWLPGDPASDEVTLLPPVWAARGSREAGLFIALDPVTRLPIAPTAEQKRGFAAQVAHDALLAPTLPLRVEKLPGGGEIIHLNGQFHVYSIARRDAKGHVITGCATDPVSARRLLTEPAPAKTVWEEK